MRLVPNTIHRYGAHEVLFMSKKSKLKKEAEKEFRKLPKKEQDRINRLKRIPVPAPGTVFDKKKDAPRQKKWDETME